MNEFVLLVSKGFTEDYVLSLSDEMRKAFCIIAEQQAGKGTFNFNTWKYE
ncbi:hypothetical protein UFOVP459_17 [uncultured Caudovirales phage]|jgi:hypothetical protein|uniref:Uncharacterized protein n=1 Tax=uncultured Caudovirales phage TaxID=2100421 RepID=A0A6J5SEC2_9CAUD|nr:hypothetical protein UFOVP459_17 [uncultured Caudovirales phage]CAB4183441.1 hypothetical protein UFOVP1089_68 [uncultured Caudovirales phage]CAB4212372.1 hypothetical protein UFOVP1443_11 [uncultured Caudovirales phage]